MLIHISDYYYGERRDKKYHKWKEDKKTHLQQCMLSLVSRGGYETQLLQCFTHSIRVV